jgi:hypothetical protein
MGAPSSVAQPATASGTAVRLRLNSRRDIPPLAPALRNITHTTVRNLAHTA